MAEHVHDWALMPSRMGVMVYRCIGCGREKLEFCDD